jgi:ferredoxin-thioredoxin reductase catalytic subunit
MTREELYEMLKKSQGSKGYLFSSNKERVNGAYGCSVVIRERYGYMCCRCRPKSETGNRIMISMPLVYRVAD